MRSSTVPWGGLALAALATGCGPEPAPPPGSATSAAETSGEGEGASKAEAPADATTTATTADDAPGEGCAPRVAELEAEVESLRQALASERARRAQREADWLAFNQGLATLDVRQLLPEPEFPAHLPQALEAAEGEGEVPAEPSPEDLYRLERAGEIAVSLRNLLRVEEVFGMDLLEVGTLQTGGVGPVVFRLLDDRGRLRGSLSAERLRLEASRAARTVTLVLEDGFESQGGERHPFPGDARRIVLPYVDPDRWLGSVPELFELSDLSERGDDGLWNLERVRRELNDRLRQDGSGGFYVLHSMSGIRGEVLLDVQVSSFDERGRLERRLFADRMRIREQPRGIQIVLEGGALVRGDEKTPFTDGRFRIFLPRARAERWREARLPGLWSPLELEEAEPERG